MSHAPTPPPFTPGQVLYRLVDSIASNGYLTAYDDWVSLGTVPTVHLEVWSVVKVTPKGAWVALGCFGDNIRGMRQWVSRNTRKFARTPAEAKDQAIARRKYHIKKVRERLRNAETRLRALEQWQETP